MTKQTDNLSDNLADLLHVQGINCKGFGLVPKYVMMDKDLTLEAKTIYAYFCSYAGQGDCAFPLVGTITGHLKVNKDTYYKHLKMLCQQGYLMISQERNKSGIFARNIYTIVSNPKKFSDIQEHTDPKKDMAYSRIRFGGLKSYGYGTIPKAVMIDLRLDIKAKGIYAYFCSLTGSGNNAFPSVPRILGDLKIGRQAYYKYYGQLVSCNYIVPLQRSTAGKYGVNDYYLVDTPTDKAQALEMAAVAFKPCDDFSDTVGNAKEIPCDDFSDTDISDTVFPDADSSDAVFSDIYNKQFDNINNYQYNQSIYHHPATPEPDGQMDIRELLTDHKIPYTYKTEPMKMHESIKYLVDFEELYPSYTDDLERSIYTTFVDALTEMCCADIIKLNGANITYAMIIDKLNMALKDSTGRLNLIDLMTAATCDFGRAIKTKRITHHVRYMQSCIWSVLQCRDLARLGAMSRT